MIRSLYLAKRNITETVKDVVSLLFIIGLPVLMLVVMELLFGDIAEAQMFQIDNFAPGICTFGYTFTMLYVAITISIDKSSAFMMKILVSPVKNVEYVASFIISSLAIMFVQTLFFYLISLFFGLSFSGKWFLSMALLIPSMLFFSSCGVLIGTLVKNDKQAGPLCSIIISGSGLLGGVWLPIEQIGGTFKTFCKVLPFYNGVSCAKDAFYAVSVNSMFSVLIVLAYAVIVFSSAVLIFNKTAKN